VLLESSKFLLKEAYPFTGIFLSELLWSRATTLLSLHEYFRSLPSPPAPFLPFPHGACPPPLVCFDPHQDHFFGYPTSVTVVFTVSVSPPQTCGARDGYFFRFPPEQGSLRLSLSDVYSRRHCYFGFFVVHVPTLNVSGGIFGPLVNDRPPSPLTPYLYTTRGLFFCLAVPQLTPQRC